MVQTSDKIEEQKRKRILAMDKQVIIKELVEYAKSVDLKENHDFYGYFKRNGFPFSPYFDTRYRDNMLDPINKAWEIVKGLKKEQKSKLIEADRQELFKHIPEAKEWMKQKGLKKMSKQNLAVFLVEKELKPAAVNRQSFYLELNSIQN